MNIQSIKHLNYSAVITTYKPTVLLKNAIESIVNQEIKPKEIILIQDGNLNYQENDIRRNIPKSIKFIEKFNSMNLGASVSRNIGARLASNEYIIFFDDDDYSLPQRSKIHLEAFKMGATVSYISSSKIYENGHVVFFQNNEIGPNSIDPYKLVRKVILGKRYSRIIGDVAAATLAVKKTPFLNLGGFDETFRRLEDVDFAIRSSIGGEIFSWSSEYGVIRNATIRKDKGGIIEIDYERILLAKWGKMLGWFNSNSIKSLISLRRLYFGGCKSIESKFLIQIAVNPFTYLVVGARFRRLLHRIIHDNRIAKK